MKQEIDLTQGAVFPQLFRMTLPMIGGIFAMGAFHLADTYFVSQLGTEELAAMAFTFPVVMILGAVSLGLGMGTSSCVSRAIGQGDEHRVKRLCTDTLILTVLITGILSILGLLFSRYLFMAMGAKERILDLVMGYMNLWLTCVAVLFIPMVGNNAIRATGNTTIPSLIMIIAAVLNVIMDPIFIFGMFGFPAMGIRGAALATVISRLISLVASIGIMHFRCRLLEWSLPARAEVIASWKDILKVALPAAATNILMPLSRGVLTWLVAGFGTTAVAAVGAANRVQMFSYVVPMAIGSVLMPFVGQNWGANRLDRIRCAWVGSNWFAFFYGITSALLVWPFGRALGSLFNDDPVVAEIFHWYLIILFLGSGLQHIAVHTGRCLNAMGKALAASYFNASRILGLMIPLAITGTAIGGLYGMFWGLSAANVIAGCTGLLIIQRALRSSSSRHVRDELGDDMVA